MSELYSREWFRSLQAHKRYVLAPIQVVDYEGPWEINHEFDAITIETILSGQVTGSRQMTFAEAYRARWFELARQDSQGRWWITKGTSIRTNLIEWARQRDIGITMNDEDILDFNPNNEQDHDLLAS